MRSSGAERLGLANLNFEIAFKTLRRLRTAMFYEEQVA
jgi:hypothetical protein